MSMDKSHCQASCLVLYTKEQKATVASVCACVVGVDENMYCVCVCVCFRERERAARLFLTYSPQD